LRKPLREAERTGKAVEVQEGWTRSAAGKREPNMVKLTPRQIRERFDGLAKQQRSPHPPGRA
jgi:hypothetical protein